MNFDSKDKEKAVAQLNSEQHRVTQKEGTEPPFKNAYWDSKEAGLYVDIVSGEPLFLSIHKYDSGTGWPSFFQPINPTAVSLHEDKGLFWSTRTEVRSSIADSHLGHVFDDGPEPTGKRYCMNSAAMRFIPKEQLAAEGFEEYLKWF
ncbi:MAG: peptide-methionine (R)-S-oxide reductase MsrB [Pseudomonadota bacterium]